MPDRGRSVMDASGSTRWPGSSTRRNRRAIAARISTASIVAKELPMHWRGPPPNGK